MQALRKMIAMQLVEPGPHTLALLPNRFGILWVGIAGNMQDILVLYGNLYVVEN